jgi:hypothetical protein
MSTEAHPIFCKICKDELGYVFSFDPTFGPICLDCEDGIAIGRIEFFSNGVTGVITENKER